MKTIFIAAVLALNIFSNTSFAAVDMSSAKAQVLEGQVGNFLEPGLFWLHGRDGVKVLVYSNGEATRNLHSGQKVRITGTAPLDWSRLVDQELNARKIEEI
jgi:hypothetical protein